jgi:unsaturated rhamnogalacturonyl hydrolase
MKQATLLLTALAFLAILFSCKTSTNAGKENMGRDYANRMAESIRQDYPHLWWIENPEQPVWSYTHGLVALAMLDLYKFTGDTASLNYVEFFADSVISDDGTIKTYRMGDYNIDKINSGKMLLRLFDISGKEKYRMAADTLGKQLESHPQTEIGGYWHKQRYPHQMWLDGLYMGGPFMAQYALREGDDKSLDFVLNWFQNMEMVARDSATGLLYHGWDESSEQQWSDPVTGCSSHFWGRGMGWFGMALVDVLDFIPEGHAGREQITGIIGRMAEAIVRVQEPDKGIWYQVLDQGDREGNYLEGSVSSMFSYFLLKAVNMGYLDKNVYGKAALKAFEGTVAHLVHEDGDRTITLSPVCAVAGLGGDPYRDGSYEYYVNERKRDNDPKGVGPFIMAGIQYAIYNQ